MADTFTTTNMGLTLPIVGTRTGTAYASDINNAIIGLDAHDHSELNGVKVTPAGLDITSDLDMQGNNIDDARSLRLTDQLANLSGVNDITSLYVTEGDLWFNNDAGAQVQLTLGGSLNTGAIVTNVWGTQAISANLTVLGSDAFTCINVSASSAINITLPAANAVSPGRFYVIQDVAGTSQTYNITVTPVSSATINGAAGAKTLSSQYGTWFIRSDGVSKWQLTYTGHSGLTATSLTYGSNVLNSTGLVLGSSSITPTVLTIGTATLQSSGLVVTDITASGSGTFGTTLDVTGALSSAALTATDGHFTEDVIIDGDLTVTGAVNIDAETLGISTITDGTITNCTISGGTIDSATLTNITATTVTSTDTTLLGTTTLTMGPSSTLTFSPAQSYSVLQSCYQGIFSQVGWSNSLTVGLQSTATGSAFYFSLTNMPYGATLESVDLSHFIANGSHSPATKLRLGVFRVPYVTPSAPEILQSTGGLVGVPIATYTFGIWTTETFLMDQNNSIDTVNYTYFCRVTEESGSGAIAGNHINSIRLNYTITNVLGSIV